MPLEKGNLASWANFEDLYLFLSAGQKVIYFNIESRVWKEAPLLNESRSYHSSCSLGGKVCIFGGYNDVNFWLSSIEFFDAQTYFNDNEQGVWEMIELKYFRF